MKCPRTCLQHAALQCLMKAECQEAALESADGTQPYVVKEPPWGQLYLAPLSASPHNSSTAASALWKKRHREEGRKAQPIAPRFARHTCRTVTGDSCGAPRGRGGPVKKSDQTVFQGQQMDWDFSSSSGSKPPQFEPVYGTGGYLPVECCLFSSRGLGATRMRAWGVHHWQDQLQGHGTGRALWSISHNTPGHSRNSSTETAGLPKTSPKPCKYSLFGDEFEIAMPVW